jgi:hypothetical protein
MLNRTHRTIGAFFLSLLIATSFLATSGWFCADGRACLPALSPVCCCGCGPSCATVGPPSAAIHHYRGLSHLSKPACRCYQDLCGTATLRSAVRIVVAAPAIVPGPGVLILVPQSRLKHPRIARVSISLPRFAISPRDTRAPPAA